MGAYMARINFTAPRIANHKCEVGKDQSLIWDLTSPCLGLRATRNGSKAYVFQAKLYGKDMRITIGSPVEWKIPDARAEANRLKVMVDQGIDPRIVAEEARTRLRVEAAARAARKMRAREAWNAYLATKKGFWSAAHYQDHINLAQEGGAVPKIGKNLTKPGPLASLLCLPLFDITAQVVADWLRTESVSRATATRNSYRKFKAFLSWCLTQSEYKHGVHGDCCIDDSVVRSVPPNVAKQGDVLNKSQLSLWFEHVRNISNPYFSAYLQALLLTGARRKEMELLKWTHVDFRWKTIRLYDTENGLGERVISLPPYLASVLAALPRINVWVFASPSSKEGHIIGAPKAHTLALQKANLPHISLHGLRRSFSTLSEWLGTVPVGVTAQIMGHSPSAIVEKHYLRRSPDFLLIHHANIEAWMLEQAGIEFTEKEAA